MHHRAMEVYDSLNQSGTLCNLITGQERREVPSATHTACTVEMCNLSSPVDVAVIDEIQLIGDQSRGYAWTRALLGVPAREVHLCGDTSALELVRWLCSQAQERLEVKSYERFTPLEIEPLRQDVDQTYEIVRPGDCIVAFSRSDIFNIKAQVEVLTPYKACVIYGALPPETRRQQARLFNDPSNEYSVMVASDAVGMGLNLNIGRIIFHTLQKGPRTGLIDVDPSAIKQIAGRAGRRSSQFSVGKVSCISPRDLKKVRQALRLPPSASLTERAGLAPEFDHFEAFAARFPEMPLHQIVDAFANQSSVQGPYFFCKQEPMVVAASLLGRVKGLTLRDLYSFVTAPASLSDKNVLAALLHWAKRYAKGQPCPLYIDPPDVIPISTTEMRTIETAHAIVSLWLWLSFRFDEEYFSDRDRAQDVAEQLSNLLSRGLESMSEVDDKAVFGFWGLEKTSSKRRQSIVSWAETTYMLAWANELEDVTHWLRDGWRT